MLAKIDNDFGLLCERIEAVMDEMKAFCITLGKYGIEPEVEILLGSDVVVDLPSSDQSGIIQGQLLSGRRAFL